MLRLFMVFKGLDRSVDIKPQEIPTFERKGFAVVEWGGMELSANNPVKFSQTK